MGHAMRVCYIATNLARSLALPDSQLTTLYHASLLHDLGVPLVSSELVELIGVNENALFAASPRKAPEEMAADCRAPVPDIIIGAFHRHVSSGGAQAIALGLPTEVGETIASSHENWDGSGYPEGLAANDIPQLSQDAGGRRLGGVGHRRGAELADRAAEPGRGTGGRLGDHPRPAAGRADQGHLPQRRLLAGAVREGPDTLDAGDEAAREREVELEDA